MLIYLNSLTWTRSPEAFAADIRDAMRLGVHLQTCHEFPSVLDPESGSGALEFKAIMDATPEDLKKWPTNIYSQIAIALKGGELRDVGLSILAAKLARSCGRGGSASQEISQAGSYPWNITIPASASAETQSINAAAGQLRGDRV